MGNKGLGMSRLGFGQEKTVAYKLLKEPQGSHMVPQGGTCDLALHDFLVFGNELVDRRL